ncbi:hypothetical protein P280DRAFT_32492 [Massarina eburnea CBS 473.64]|uniref:Uncharacterized protein n=1 Tax=Massarina eburnea CBS 473.64 TaxID=1395130 RepID=A0A6A6RXK3_9PLEO|nr:hypothetical protein P280DRAFT_32492 [Massarina eburnea CBS 473.64]
MFMFCVCGGGFGRVVCNNVVLWSAEGMQARRVGAFFWSPRWVARCCCVVVTKLKPNYPE